MSTKNQYVDPNDEMLQRVEEQNTAAETEYTTDINAAIASNEAAKDAALGLTGVDENGKIVEGSALDNLQKVQQEQTDFAISEIERQKEKAEKDYTKEQTAAYVDWQRQSAQHGVEAERMAQQGLEGSGYAESSKVSMYNQYQARITAARESFQQIQADYNAAITNARLQNSSAMAQIAVDALKQRLEITLQFAMKNTELLTTLAQNKASLRQQGFSNYMSVYNQLFNNAQLSESARQHDESLAFQKEKWDWEKEQAANNGGYIVGENTGGTTDGITDYGEQIGPSLKSWAVAELENIDFVSETDVYKFLTELNNKVGGGKELDVPLLTYAHWEKAKRSGQKDYATQFNSYSQYLKAYATDAVDFYFS